MLISKLLKYKNSGLILRLVGFDLLAAALAWILTFQYRLKFLNISIETISFNRIGFNALLVGIFWLLFYSFFGFYVDIFRKSRIREILKLLTVSFFGVTIIFFLLLLDNYGPNSASIYTKIFITYYCLQALCTSIFKVGVITRIKSLIKHKTISFNTLILGSDKNALDIFQEIENSFDVLGFNFIAYMHVINKNSNVFLNKLRHLGGYENLGKMIRRCHIEHVIIAIEPYEHHKINEILTVLEKYNVKISILPDVYQLLIGSVKVNHIFDIPLVEINQDILPVWQNILKRTFDVVISLLVFTFGFPFLLFVAIATKISSSGPIFYLQERIGRDNVPFKIFKFRSMIVNAESKGPSLSSENDPRITKWGKFMRKTRIDEFPQFYNVLLGDMSLVGPRPERRFYIDQIIAIAPHYKHLHKVKPGITSLGQVKFGYAENVEQMVRRLKYDILYIENMSIAMDLRIIFYTIVIMIEGRGK